MKHIKLFEQFINEASADNELSKKEKQLESLAKKIVKQIPSFPGFKLYKGSSPEDDRDFLSDAAISNHRKAFTQIDYVRAAAESANRPVMNQYVKDAWNGTRYQTHAFFAKGDPNGYEPFMYVTFAENIELPKGRRNRFNAQADSNNSPEPDYWVFKIGLGIGGRKIEFTENLYVRYTPAQKENYDPFIEILTDAFNSSKMTSVMKEYFNLMTEVTALIEGKEANKIGESFINEKKNWNDPDPYNIGDEFMDEFPKNRDWEDGTWSSLEDWMREEWGPNAGIEKDKGFDDCYDTVQSYLSGEGYSV